MSDAVNQSPTSSEIIAALERTGFLLEHRAARELENAGFDITINDAFPDSDTGKSRETDIYGMIEQVVRGTNVTVSAHALVECKNYSTPLVLVGESNPRSFFPVDTTYVSFDPLKLYSAHEPPNRTILTALNLQWAYPDDQIGGFTGYQLVRMNRKSGDWHADNSSIYDGILYPLLKARQHEVDRNGQDNHKYVSWEDPVIAYYFPILLTAGEIYTVAVRERVDPEVTKVKWAILRRLFHTNNLQTTLIVDIVSFDHFGEYLDERVAKTASRARDIIKDNSNLYDPEWLLSNYGLPRQKEIFDEWLEAFRAKGP
jgi:hypothetical protein